MYKKMVNPLAHGVSKHHLLKEAPESKPSDEVSRSWENATQRALFDRVDNAQRQIHHPSLLNIEVGPNHNVANATSRNAISEFKT